MYYGFDLDEHYEDLWHALERIQDGKSGHKIAMKACDATNAANEIGVRLANEFFRERMYPCDQWGNLTLLKPDQGCAPESSGNEQRN